MNKHTIRKIQRILNTNQGERVMNPNFGINYNLIQDKTISSIKLKMHILDALEEIHELNIDKINIKKNANNKIIISISSSNKENIFSFKD